MHKLLTRKNYTNKYENKYRKKKKGIQKQNGK